MKTHSIERTGRKIGDCSLEGAYARSASEHRGGFADSAADQGETTPIKRIRPTGILADFILCAAKSGGRRQLVTQQRLVELGHENRRGPIVHAPQSSQDVRSTGVEEASHQPDLTFVLQPRAERGPASAQHYQSRVDLPLINVDEPKESIARTAIRAYQRKDDARQFRPLLVQQSVGGKVENADFRGRGTERVLAIGREIRLDPYSRTPGD